MKIKVGYFIDTNLDRGGAPISTKVLAEGIAKKVEYECVLVKPYNKNKEELDNVKLTYINDFEDEFPFIVLHPIKWISLCVKVYNNIKKEKYNIIHANMPFSGMAIGLLKKIKLIKNNICLIYTDREHVADLKWYHRIRYNFFIAKEFDKVITISQKSKKYWDEIRKNKNTDTIYNTATETYEELIINNSKSKRLNILFVGRMAKDKNWELAIKIIKKLDNCNITIIISYFNEEQKKEAEIILKKLSANSNVKVKFNVNVNDIREYYANSDIFVMTSIREDFGRTAVEAMSQKTIVIGTNIGGIPEVINKKENILDLDDNKFIERINYYDKNRNELANDKEYFYNRYRNNFSVNTYISKYDNIYKKMVKMDEK